MNTHEIILRGLPANVKQMQKKADICDIKGIENIISQISIDIKSIDRIIDQDEEGEQYARDNPETFINGYPSTINKYLKRKYLQDKKDYREAINTLENRCKCFNAE